MKSLAILLSLVASTAFAQTDLEIAIALAKAKAKAKATVAPVSIKTEPKINPAPQTRTVTYEAEYRTERYVSGKQCVRLPNGQKSCRPVYSTRQILVRPARTVEVPVEAPAANVAPDQQPTPMSAVGHGLDAMNVRGKRFVEFGCGHDARWCIVAVRDRGAASAIGIEIDPAVAESARRYVAKAGLSDRIAIITGDATAVNVEADCGVAYLFSDTLAKLRPQIQKLDQFVSYAHAVPGLSMRQQGDLFIYRRPVSVQQVSRPSLAYWNGNWYARANPGCNCPMCQSIRSQLYSWN